MVQNVDGASKIDRYAKVSGAKCPTSRRLCFETSLYRVSSSVQNHYPCINFINAVYHESFAPTRGLYPSSPSYRVPVVGAQLMAVVISSHHLSGLVLCH